MSAGRAVSIRLPGRAQSACSRCGIGHMLRGHAAESASTSQLAISSVPPVGAAIGNRLWPAYCRKRQVAREQGRRDRQSRTPAARPMPRMKQAPLGERDRAKHGGRMKQQHRGGGAKPRCIGLMRGRRGQDDATGAHQAGEHDQDAIRGVISCVPPAGAPWPRAIPACRRRSATRSRAPPGRPRDVWPAPPRFRRRGAQARPP